MMGLQMLWLIMGLALLVTYSLYLCALAFLAAGLKR
jgi:hypothetical protein